LLFLLIGLHLFDALTLNSWLPSSWADVHFNNPRLEALASGALAVLIATPCTAPFMGASLGMAVGLPAAQALLIFLLLGVGMALPFLALSLYPAVGAWLQRQLPRPGAWMNDLRHLLAWPMFATVLWLLWVYALQTSVLQTLTAALAMLMLMAFLWSLKLAPGRLRTVSVALMGLLLVLSCVRLATLQQNQAAIAAIGSPSKLSVSSWQAWTPELQASLRASGQPVLVDFTAAWCITCQVNKSTTLETAATLALLQSKQVALLKADWTRPNPAIAAELQRLGRSGLPVYALYLPGAEQPQLLPEILSPATIERAVSLIQ
jgi:thiol:disulfide interchange protein DsbD